MDNPVVDPLGLPPPPVSMVVGVSALFLGLGGGKVGRGEAGRGEVDRGQTLPGCYEGSTLHILISI